LRQVTDDERDRQLAELRVWAPDDADIHRTPDVCAASTRSRAGDVRSAPDDDVLDTPDDVQISRVIDEAEVAHVRPPSAAKGPKSSPQ